MGNFQRQFKPDLLTLDNLAGGGALQCLLDGKNTGLLLVAEDHTILDASDAGCTMLGYSKSEMLGLKINQLLHSNDLDQAPLFSKAQEQNSDAPRSGEKRYVTKAGQVFWGRFNIQTIHNRRGVGHCDLVMIEDISEIKELEQQVRHAQKMEAAGQLSGGIAHDFNNILTVIQGYCDLIIPGLPKDSELVEQLAAIESAGQRGSALTRQLLAFGHKQQVNRDVLEPKQQLTELLHIIRRTLGEKITLEENLHSRWNIKEDPAQFEQVVLNLLVNARHAMPDGGVLAIETANVTITKEDTMTADKDDYVLFTQEQAKPGDYVLLSISDTGTGMDKEVIKRIFQPFYTTKSRGQGTGLGLSVVYNMVKQSGGAIYVETCKGEGTCFKVFFPKERRQVKRIEPQSSILPSGGGRILLVEDDADVRNLTLSILASAGYTVDVAGDPLEILEGDFNDNYDLVLSDVIMPKMNGPEFSRHWLARHPEDKFLFMSGYADDEILSAGSPVKNLLRKPFKPIDLLHRVEQSIRSSRNEEV